MIQNVDLIVHLSRITSFVLTDSDKDRPESSPSRRWQRSDQLSEQERALRSRAFDYDTRYCGHCNTTTDIKEANFFGR